MRSRGFLAAACAAALVLPATAGAQQPVGSSPVERPDLHPGDVVRVGAVGAHVPARGRFVAGEALNTDGAQEVIVSTDSAGRVFVDADDGDPALYDPDPKLAAGSPGPCSDGAYARATLDFGTLGKKPYKWTSEYDWYFHSSTTPTNITAANALDDIIAGTVNMKDDHNDCGLADGSHATSAYQGSTGLATQINTDGTCAANDGNNVAGFGVLNPTNTLAITCTWGKLGLNPLGDAVAIESDVRFDKDNHSWFTGAVPSTCSNRWSLAGVATHERGHTFGLGHVAENGHGNLTMSPLINGACQKSEATLGLGDVRGMNAIYP